MTESASTTQPKPRLMSELQVVQEVYPRWRDGEAASYLLWEGTAWPMCGVEHAQWQLRTYYGSGCRAGWWRRIWRKFAMKQREWDNELRLICADLKAQGKV